MSVMTWWHSQNYYCAITKAIAQQTLNAVSFAQLPRHRQQAHRARGVPSGRVYLISLTCCILKLNSYSKSLAFGLSAVASCFASGHPFGAS